MPRFKRPTNRTLVIGGSTLLVAAALFASLFIWGPFKPQHSPASNSNSSLEALLPAKSSDTPADWKESTTPNGQPIVSFTDTLDSVPLNISQQPLPDDFKNNGDAMLADMAKGFNATGTIQAGATKAYIGVSAQGPQWVIFAKKNLLVIIKSNEKIQNESWINYISALK